MSAIRRTPLSLQVFLVILATFLVAQGLTIAAIVLAPPRGAPMFTYRQMAAVLQGRPALPSGARRLIASRKAALPEELAAPMSAREALAAQRLARALAVPPADVRFRLRAAPALVILTSGRGRPAPGQVEAPLQAPPLSRVEPTQVRGEIVAAVRRPDGGWTVLTPTPEREWVRRLAIWVAGWVLIICPVAYLFARRLTAPLRRFAASADRLGRAQQVEPLDVSASAEIATAAQAFNAMQKRISRFVSDRVGMMGAISHDLRTPLTRIRFKAERADAELRAALLRDVEQMEVMINSVLAFIRDDRAAGAPQRLDLASLVACAVDEAAATGADVTLAVDSSVSVEADPVALQRVFENLIGNAVKYGGRARVSLTCEGGEARVAIQDEGPGLPAADLERVFQPFYRTPGAKAAVDGVGLGLTVSRSIARSYGGDVVLRPAKTGLIAEVTLPLATG